MYPPPERGNAIGISEFRKEKGKGNYCQMLKHQKYEDRGKQSTAQRESKGDVGRKKIEVV